MDYKKKYEEALARAREWSETKNGYYMPKELCEEIFPELQEPEDEKIRKSLIALVKSKEEDGYMVINNFSTGSILAWLEKQGKQKHAWSEENEAVLDALIRSLEGEDIYVSPHLAAECLKSIKDRVQPQPKQKWSEEDEHRLKDIIYFLDTAKKHYASTVELDACIDWLKSLKDCIQPQNHWKPSEEHVHWLKWAINRLPDTEKANEAEAILEDLLKQLKEL